MTTSPNLDRLALVAHALGPLRNDVVFVGGCTTELLLDPAARAGVRYTEDVDLIVDITSRRAYHELETTLRGLGFRNSPAVICRWEYPAGNLPVIVDIMPTDASILGFSNPFYEEGFETALHLEIRGLDIRHLNHANFLGTKLVAFDNRGHSDYLASQDMEDIVTLLDGCRELAIRISEGSSIELKTFLRGRLLELRASADFGVALTGNCPRDAGTYARRNLDLCIDVLNRVLTQSR